MSKRTSFADLLGTKEQTQENDGPPVSAQLHTITGNPDNPRDPDELELDELIMSFREVGQLQPVLAMSRDVYLRHKPRHKKKVGDAQYVILGGNRRLEAARALGWARIDIQLRDDLGDGDGSLDEAVIIENIHRKALAPIREAAFLQGMVERYGSQGRVAERIGKTQAYVSQRLSLLKLAPELQQAVDAGELKVKTARQLSSVPQERQRDAWQKAEAVDAPTAGHNPVMAPPPGPVDPVSGAPGRSDEEPPSFTAVKPEVPEVPEQRPEPSPDPQPVEPVKPPQIKMPWADGAACADIAITKMDATQLARMIGRLMDHVGGHASATE